MEGKLAVLTEHCEARGVPLSDVVYVGNDVNDVECLNAVGCAVVVADAEASTKRHAHLILNERGGRGALRELSDLILSRKER